MMIGRHPRGSPREGGWGDRAGPDVWITWQQNGGVSLSPRAGMGIQADDGGNLMVDIEERPVRW